MPLSPNNCTALVRPPDITSRSPGALNPALWMPSSSPPSTPSAATPPLTDLYLPPAGAHQRGTHANDPQTNTKIGAVRQRLSAWLPEYMVPTHIVVLDEFPMTSSGKLDRKALPAPVFAATAFRAPQTQTEKIVAGVFAEVLGLDRVGVDDSFFDLGGDSLSAMRLIAAVNTGLDADLSVRAVFEAPTVAQLAPRIGKGGGPGAVDSRWSGRRWCRCRLPRAGCGSSTSCRGRHRFTTWWWRCG